MREQIGSYKIVSQLGRGGMGVVYKGYDESLDRHVAIKVLSDELTADATFLERFRREAKSAAGLNHPNITQIYHIGEDGPTNYFVMEFVVGPSLSELIKTKGRLETMAATKLVLQAALGLAVAHDAGVIHRDIKPANLMFDERTGLVKIADFGLAHMPASMARLTVTGGLMGTPGYLSPEQCYGKQPDHRSDIYSLGVTFYELLTGSLPFDGDSPIALLRAVCEATPKEVTELNDKVPLEINHIVRRMMVREPGERYQTCHEVAHELDAFLTENGVRATGPVSLSAIGVGAAVAAAAAATPNDGEATQDLSQLADDGGSTQDLSQLPDAEATREVASVAPGELPTQAVGVDPIQFAKTRPLAEATPAAAKGAAVHSGSDTIEFSDVPASSPNAARPKKKPWIAIAAVAAILLLAGSAAALYVGSKVFSSFSNSDESDGEIAALPLVATTDATATDIAAPDRRSESTTEPEADVLSAVEGGEATTIHPEAAVGSSDDVPAAAVSEPAAASASGAQASQQQPAAVVASNQAHASPARAAAAPRVKPAVAAPQPVAPQPAAPQPAPAIMLPAIPRVVIIVQGEPLLGDAVESYLADECERLGLDVADSGFGTGRVSIQSLAGSLAADDVNIAIVANVDLVSERELNHMGGYSTALTSTIKVRAYIVANQKSLGRGFKEKKEYTSINAEGKAQEAIDEFVDDLVDSVNSGWSHYRSR